MDPQLVTLLVGLLGGGTVATIATLIVKYRADNARTFAEAGKTSSEGKAVDADAVQRRYDSLFDDLESELKRRNEDRDRLAGDLADAQADNARLRLEVVEATAQVKLARTEVVHLQQRVDDLEKVHRR